MRKEKNDDLYFFTCMATVLITGGTGLIGKALCRTLLSKGYEVIVLTRKIPVKNPIDPRVKYAEWNVKEQTIDANAIKQADHIVHLAGANVGDKRWTTKRKNEIVESRTQSSALIIRALKENQHKVKSVISASAIGWYVPNRDDGQKNEAWKGRHEDEPSDESFLGTTCKLWEESVEPINSMGIRLVKLRTGLVLSNEGGLIKEFKKPLRFGFATILSNGRQVLSWIHIDDLVRLYIYAIENESMRGVYNAVAPTPVTNRSFVLQFAKEIKGKFYVPIYIPSFVLKIVLGEMSVEVLKSVKISSEKTKKAGFIFSYPEVKAALRQLCAS